MERYGECLNFKNIYHSKTLPLILLQVLCFTLKTLKHFIHHSCHFLRLSWKCFMNVQLCCHSCICVLNQFEAFAFHGHFESGEESQFTQCQIWLRQTRIYFNFFISLSFYFISLSRSIHPIFDQILQRHFAKEDFQNHFGKWQDQQDKYIQNEGVF